MENVQIWQTKVSTLLKDTRLALQKSKRAIVLIVWMYNLNEEGKNVR